MAKGHTKWESPLVGEGGWVILLYLQIKFVVILKHSQFIENIAAEVDCYILLGV